MQTFTANSLKNPVYNQQSLMEIALYILKTSELCNLCFTPGRQSAFNTDRYNNTLPSKQEKTGKKASTRENFCTLHAVAFDFSKKIEGQPPSRVMNVGLILVNWSPLICPFHSTLDVT